MGSSVLRRIDGVLWLRGYRFRPEHIWSAGDHFVFTVSPTKETEAQGEMALTPEGLYFYGLLTILAEGPTKSVELVEGRAMPDLASLAGEDERLRALAERQPSAQVHPDSRKLIGTLLKL